MLAMAASGRSVHAQSMPAELIGVRAPSGGPSGLFDRSQPEGSTAGVDPFPTSVMSAVGRLDARANPRLPMAITFHAQAARYAKNGNFPQADMWAKLPFLFAVPRL